MIIPLWSILILWAIFVGVTVLFSLFNLYHILHYGFWTFQSALFSFLYYGIVIIIIFWTLQQLPQFDWSQPIFTLGRPDLSLPDSL
ncbi:MAG: hypothetical protein UX17_C0082G0003 [Parcubacteria group bacterium GW2011_GWC2_45_7]|uniref:Uncharacterized protein n=1 Tax=Candidatus Magasanikbacteria bacterium GW2011_GWA2_50_22 TaxID=1619043 RepID=A0A0G1WFV3_9BACT|nr:MAG: hypothetical protein UX17_C0082G0003 [Parcubacteria group bacterium GW2011_GWC2_45_7]KKW17520.1 MAG: hypothetical protein UY58_C0002G0006 [Candidatus Magasanikbacteria bacterium GW2011_GWA2_50_22]